MQSLVISSPLHRTEIAPSSAKVFNADVITIQSIHIILRTVRYHGMDFLSWIITSSLLVLQFQSHIHWSANQ
jgi:hypothetical protein